jgi:hypothetical protein
MRTRRKTEEETTPRRHTIRARRKQQTKSTQWYLNVRVPEPLSEAARHQNESGGAELGHSQRFHLVEFVGSHLERSAVGDARDPPRERIDPETAVIEQRAGVIDVSLESSVRVAFVEIVQLLQQLLQRRQRFRRRRCIVFWEILLGKRREKVRLAQIVHQLVVQALVNIVEPLQQLRADDPRHGLLFLWLYLMTRAPSPTISPVWPSWAASGFGVGRFGGVTSFARLKSSSSTNVPLLLVEFLRSRCLMPTVDRWSYGVRASRNRSPRCNRKGFSSAEARRKRREKGREARLCRPALGTPPPQCQ